MSKTTQVFPYLCAINILKNDFKYIVTNEIEEPENKNEIILQSEEQSPEKMLLRKEEYDLLSIEAKEIVQTILNCPEEILELFKTKQIKKISKRKISEVFSEIWQSEYIANSAIQEIIRWVKTF